jgi:nucleotide-binding universal stress UspA family protein
MFRRLLICTDFSDGLHRLVHFVPSLAGAGIQQIIFLHSVPLWESGEIPRIDTDRIESARQKLSVALEQVPPGVDVQITVESGHPIDLIDQAAQDFQVDLILLGIPNRNLLVEKLFGSTAIGLCQRTTVPIMTLRPQLISIYTSEELDLRCRHLFRNLLIAYDDSEAAQYLVKQIKHIAQNRPPHSLERCHLCWVVEDVGRRGVPREYQVKQAEARLAQVKADLESVNLLVEAEVRQGNPLLEVLDAAQMSDVSAIALSSETPNKLVDWSVPSFTNEVLRRSWHPVIYFPPER